MIFRNTILVCWPKTHLNNFIRLTYFTIFITSSSNMLTLTLATARKPWEVALYVANMLFIYHFYLFIYYLHMFTKLNYLLILILFYLLIIIIVYLSIYLLFYCFIHYFFIYLYILYLYMVSFNECILLLQAAEYLMFLYNLCPIYFFYMQRNMINLSIYLYISFQCLFTYAFAYLNIDCDIDIYIKEAIKTYVYITLYFKSI